MILSLFSIKLVVLFFFARARVNSVAVRAPIFAFLALLAILTIHSSLLINLTWASPVELVRDSKGRVQNVISSDAVETGTRQKMKILDSRCMSILSAPKANPLKGDMATTILPHVRGQRGGILLESLNPQQTRTMLETVWLGDAQGLLRSVHVPVPASTKPQDLQVKEKEKSKTKVVPEAVIPTYPLAITFIADKAGKGDLAFGPGDNIVIRTGGQMYRYELPSLRVPDQGILRLYLGTDDQLYFDAGLTHPAHAGKCEAKKA